MTDLPKLSDSIKSFRDTSGIEFSKPDPAPFNLPLTLDEYGRLKEIQADEYAAKTPSAEFTKEIAELSTT